MGEDQKLVAITSMRVRVKIATQEPRKRDRNRVDSGDGSRNKSLSKSLSHLKVFVWMQIFNYFAKE
jgi:hypothetical protein